MIIGLNPVFVKEEEGKKGEAILFDGIVLLIYCRYFIEKFVEKVQKYTFFFLFQVIFNKGIF